MTIGISTLYTNTVLGNNGTTQHTSNFTPANNSLVVVVYSYWASSQNLTTSSSSFTCSGGSLTWTKQLVNVYPLGSGIAQQALAVFTAPVTTGSSMSATIGLPTSSGVEYQIAVYNITGYNTSTPVGATATGTNLGAGAGSITLSASPATSSLILAAVASSSSATVTSAIAAGSGWTTLYNTIDTTGYDNPQQQYITGTSSTTVSWTTLLPGTTVYDQCQVLAALEFQAASSSNTYTESSNGVLSLVPSSPHKVIVSRGLGAGLSLVPSSPKTFIPGSSGVTYNKSSNIQIIFVPHSPMSKTNIYSKFYAIPTFSFLGIQ